MSFKHGPVFLLILGMGLIAAFAHAQEFHVPPGKIAGDVLMHQEIKAGKATLSAQNSAQYSRLGIKLQRTDAEDCALYVTHPLSEGEINKLKAQGIDILPTYIPPVPGRHAYGFYLASVAYASLGLIQSDARFLRLDSVEYAARPLNDLAGVQTHAAEVQNGTGVTARNGAGVKIAVADSGFDLTHADLPTPVEAYDMTDGNSIATWGTNVANLISPHGTHVLGSIGGSGLLSSGKYKGSAPGASYYLYKIGNDTNASASNADIIEAINRAKTVGCSIFSMSYGGINSSLDGSDSLCQAIDSATAAGMTCFISAGNDGGGGDGISHTRVEVAPGSNVGSIAFTIDNTAGFGTYTTSQGFALLWRDNLIPDQNIALSCTNLTIGESISGGFGSISTRGTETRSYTLIPSVAAGASKTYLLTLTNSAVTGATPPVHVFRNVGDGFFPAYVDSGMVSSPAVADTALAVAAWTQRKSWTNFNGSGFQFSSLTVNTLAPFSSRGPRIDGVIKPEIAAPGAATISARDSVAGLANTASLIIDNDGLNQNGSGPANYYVMTGTSMACPYAAGIGALVLESNPTLTPAELRSILQQTAAHPLSPDSDSGYGLLNALAGVQLAESIPDQPEADLFNGVAALPDGGGPVMFGAVPRGATMPTVTLRLSNTGEATLFTSGTVTLPPGFSLVEGLSTSIAAGTSDTFTIQLDTATSGTFSGTASFANSDADENPYSFTLEGTVTQPELDSTPASLDFGSWDVDDGTTGPRTITISNSGTGDLIMTSATLTGADASAFAFSSGPNLAAIASGGSRGFSLNFDPPSTGSKQAQLRIVTNDTDETTVTFALSGTGIDQEIAATPASLAFGSRALDDGPSLTQSVSIDNQGSAPLQISSVALSGSVDFWISSDSGETTLAPGASRNVQIFFDPSASGVQSGNLVILSDDTDEPTLNVPLSGSGLAPALSLSAPELNFAPVDIVLGDLPTTQALALSNTGDAPLLINGLTISGAQPQDFSLVTTPTLPLSLDPAGTFTLQLRFAPLENTRSLDLSALLTITSNVPALPASVTLRGDAVPVELSVLTID